MYTHMFLYAHRVFVHVCILVCTCGTSVRRHARAHVRHSVMRACICMCICILAGSLSEVRHSVMRACKRICICMLTACSVCNIRCSVMSACKCMCMYTLACCLSVEFKSAKTTLPCRNPRANSPENTSPCGYVKDPFVCNMCNMGVCLCVFYMQTHTLVHARARTHTHTHTHTHTPVRAVSHVKTLLCMSSSLPPAFGIARFSFQLCIPILQTREKYY